jgi:glyoxylase-like metal-dependent hydrolase (beta-lactamase superfamily II)
VTAMNDMTATLRILEPYPGLYAYYDGRIAGKRLHSAEPNWLDDGAYSLGIASYALVAGREAIVYDTHVSLDHALAIRTHLAGLGVTSMRVVLSHWHDDHIAGNAVFADCEIIALQRTADLLHDHKDKLENENPPIRPLVMPNRLFETRLDLILGTRRIELHHFDIHSADGCVLWLPDEQILLAGDTLEDTVTYISEPEHIATHIAELSRMATWPISRILPNHGDPDRIAAGGYETSLIAANRHYLERLLDPANAAGAEASLETFAAADITSGAVLYFEPYETVHRQNVAAIRAATRGCDRRP